MVSTLEATKAGLGKRRARPDQVNDLVVLDIVGDMASAKSISPDDIDLLHVLRLNGEWRIVNVLWQPFTPPQSTK